MPDVIAAPSAAPTQAESSPAPVNHQEVINRLTPEQRSKWQMTGELPKPADPAPAKESSDAAPQKEAAESAPAPEASKETQEKPQRSNAESRIRELLAENKRLKEAASRQEPKTQAEPSPAPVEKKAEPLEAPKKPKVDDFKSWEEYEAAKDKYYEDLTEFKKKEAIAEFQRETQEQVRQQRLMQELTEGRKRYQDFDSVVAPVYNRIMAEPLDQTVLAMVGNSPVFVDLMYALGDQAALDDFVQTAKTNPYLAIRKVVILEGLVQEELAKKTSGKETERNDKGQFQPTPEKKVTSAPPPPAEVGGTATAPEDAAKEALQKRDFAAYAREVNRREMAARKGN